jgi:quercetin dioxygenase-like cupin family protein
MVSIHCWRSPNGCLDPSHGKENTTIAKFCQAALCFLSVGVLVTAHAQEPLKVDTRGLTAKILYEAPIDGGHLPELNSKYKMRSTEIIIAPGGHVGDHNHLRSGTRQMTVGAMEYILPDKMMIYRAGDFFFETGRVVGGRDPSNRGPGTARRLPLSRAAACHSTGTAVPGRQTADTACQSCARAHRRASPRVSPARRPAG